jgi:hypothetical protein
MFLASVLSPNGVHLLCVSLLMFLAAEPAQAPSPHLPVLLS